MSLYIYKYGRIIVQHILIIPLSVASLFPNSTSILTFHLHPFRCLESPTKLLLRDCSIDIHLQDHSFVLLFDFQHRAPAAIVSSDISTSPVLSLSLSCTISLKLSLSLSILHYLSQTLSLYLSCTISLIFNCYISQTLSLSLSLLSLFRTCQS